MLIELKPSGIDKGGVGVFVVSAIKKGKKVAEGIHEEDYKEIIPWTSLKRFSRAVQKKVMDFCIGTPEGFIPIEDMNFNALTVEWYFNHSCNADTRFSIG